MESEFRELKPHGPEQGNGFIPVVQEKIDVDDQLKKKKEKYDLFLRKKVTQKEITVLDQLFYDEYKNKELKFMDPDYKEVKCYNIKHDPPPPPRISMKYYQPLQFVTHATVRYLKTTHPLCIVGVTPHFVFFGAFIQKDIKYIGNIHVMEIKKLFHGRNYEKVPFLQLRLQSQFVDDNKKEKMKLNATFTNPDYEIIKILTQIVYRNLSLAYANSNFKPQLLIAQTMGEDEFDVYDDQESEDNFPPFDDFIKEKLSPSQRFQFTYAANCSHDYVPYNHEIVTYFHSQVINFNGVFNAGYIPTSNRSAKKESISQKNNLYEMVPLFRSLIYSEYIHGVVCDVKRPDIFKAVSYQLVRSSNIAFLHLSHVHASDGLSDLYVNMFYNIDHCGVVYFDFSGNNIKNEIINLNFKDAPETFEEKERKRAKSFFDIFRKYKSEVIYFSFNECEFEKQHLNALFSAMNSYKSLSKLKYLHISGSQLIDESRELLKNYFDVYQTLVSLDIGNMPDDAKDIEKVIEMIHHQPLECLYLYNDQITDKCFEALKNLIDDVPSLSVLDVSGTGLTSDHVARIVEAMSSRQNYRMLTIKASRLGIYGVGTATIVRGFLNGQLDQWETIYLDSNNMRTSDLQLLVPLFQQMINLRELSLSDNFDSEMMGIDLELCNILRIPGLRILHLAGSDKKQLGNKIKPFILATALSYLIRSKIGGLAIFNREQEQREYSEEAEQLIEPRLKVKDTDLKGYSSYLQKKFDNILKPFLMDVKKEAAISYLQTFEGGAEWRQIFRDLVPLVEKCRGMYQYQKNDIKKKSIADYAMEILVYWAKKVPLNVDTSMENEIIKASESIDKAKWINMAANLSHLKHLDIKDVKIELDVVTALLQIDKELRGIEIDGCGIKKISLLAEFVETIENQPNLTKVPFPDKDKDCLIEQVIDDARPVVEHDLNDLQFRLMTAVNSHRFAMHRSDEDEIPEYPFETIPEMQDYIKMRKYSKKNLRSHSGISEDFGMQLPYLHLDKDDIFTGLPDDYYIDSDDIIKKMLVYQFEPPPFQNKPPEKSIAIQERFYEIDPELLTDSDEESEYTDESTEPPPVQPDLDRMRGRIKVNWDFMQSEQSSIIGFESDDSSEEDKSDDDKTKDDSLDESDIPDFDQNASKKIKPKNYRRPQKKIDFLQNPTETTDDSTTFNNKHRDLGGKIDIDSTKTVSLNFKPFQQQFEEPPK